jgi:exonuclease SbcC
LGALFIDEGFGSLDVDTLETSIDVLRELQNSGRMIGVITHVEAMQAELPIGITVEKKSSGSTLKVGSAA